MTQFMTTRFSQATGAIHRADRYCGECNRGFSRPSEYRRHLTATLIHNKEARIHPCPMCNKRFTQKSNLPEHLRSAHGIHSTATETEQENKSCDRTHPYKCVRERRSRIRRRLAGRVLKNRPVKMEPVPSPSLSSGLLSGPPLAGPSSEPPQSPQVLSSDAMQPLLSSGFESLLHDFHGYNTVSNTPLAPLESFVAPPLVPRSPDDESSLFEELVRIFFLLGAPQGLSPFPPPSFGALDSIGQQLGQGFNMFRGLIPEPFPWSLNGQSTSSGQLSFMPQQAINTMSWNPTSYDNFANMSGEQHRLDFFDYPFGQSGADALNPFWSGL